MNRHIADAKKTEISLSTLEKQRGEPGKYRMYCRAAVEKGILKVYLFAVTDIEENINFPRYRLFISRKERRFITYDEKLKKWRKALLESILWDARIDFGNIYVNDCDTKVIQKYLKTMQPAIRALEEFQANIRKEQRIRHDKKLTDSWDQVMKTVSGLPKNWIGWVSKYGITEHYIFYKYQKNGATEGYCTYCKKHVPIRSPKYNQKGQCNVCGQPITFRSVGKSGRFCTKWYRVYLIQRRRKTSGFVLRIFHARTWYKKGGYTDCETTCHEEQRRIFSANGEEISNFVYDLFKQREMRWISCRSSWYYTCCDSQYKGMVYPYTLSDLSRHELKETGLYEYALGQKKIDPGKYLYLWKTYPVLEQIVKAGLFQLVDDVLDHRATDAIKRKGRKPTEFLSVNKKEFRRLRDMNGGVKELKWLQLEKSTGKTIRDEEICWMVKEGFEPNDLKFVLDQMSICQIRHYLVKQSEKSGDDISHVLQVWNDYLSMAKRLGMDIHDSIIYRTRDLQLRHKEAVLKIEEMKRGIRRRELEEKYVGFQKHLIDLKEKYEFSDGEYQVIAPKINASRYRHYQYPWDEYQVFQKFSRLVRKNPKIRWAKADDTFSFAGLDFEFFNGYSRNLKDTTKDICNGSSLVFKISGKKTSMLFTGDIVSSIGKRLIKTYHKRLKATYLQAPHHGNNDKRESFFKYIHAKVTFIDAPSFLRKRDTVKRNIKVLKDLGEKVYTYNSRKRSVTIR